MAVDPARVKSLFLAASDLTDPSTRAAFLDRECQGDAELRVRVDALLRAHDDATLPPGAVHDDRDDPTARGGAVLAGRYKLVEEIGEGGMGRVFMAQQVAPVKRTVAVKVIKAGMDSEALLARFEAERQALAMMDHQNIARVLDAGTTDGGRPFFVMELVKGQPITEYCDQHKLTPRQRLELFVPVCHALQHAHQKGIIHRDIKPSNVLVAMFDDRPVPKVIDFGVAKALGTTLTEKTLMTGFGAVVGTPEYMSPEQANLNNLDIDTRSDVYSLGVLLYELLTGSTPLDRKSLGKAAFLEVLRVVREVEAPRPSQKLSTIDTLANVAAQRSTEPQKLAAAMRGELDWVLMKALEKDRSRRYESANGLARDIQRYLDDDLVEARPPSTGYRLHKFVRRHRGQVIAAALVFLALVAGVVGTSLGLVEAQRQRSVALASGREAVEAREAETKRAEAEAKERLRAELAEQAAKDRAAELQRVADFHSGMLKRVSPVHAGEQLNADVLAKYAASLAKEGVPEAQRFPRLLAFASEWDRVNAVDIAAAIVDREILAPAVKALSVWFANQPLVDAQLRQTLATLYQDLGRSDAAEPLHASALATRRRLLGDDDRLTIDSIFGMAHLMNWRKNAADGERFAREAFEKYRLILGEDAPNTVWAMELLAGACEAQGRWAEAEPYRRKLYQRQPDGGRLLRVAKSLEAQGKTSEAAALRATAEQLLVREIAGNPPAVRFVNASEDLVRLLVGQGRLVEAEPLAREGYERARRELGEDAPYTLDSLETLAKLLRDLNRFAEAEPYWRDVVEWRRRRDGEDSPDTVHAMRALGRVLRLQGKVAEAEPLLTGALALFRRRLGEEHADTVLALLGLGDLRLQQGRYAEVIAMLTPAEGMVRRLGARDGTDQVNQVARLLTQVGRARIGLANPADFAAAEAALLEAQAIFAAAKQPRPDSVRDCLQALVDLYVAWDRAEPAQEHGAKAVAWRNGLAALPAPAVVAAPAIGGPAAAVPDPTRPELLIALRALRRMVAFQNQQGQHEAAWRWASALREFCQQQLGAEDSMTLGATDELVAAGAKLGKHDECEAMQRFLLEVRRRVLGPAHGVTLRTQNNLVGMLRTRGKKAEELVEEEVELALRQRRGDAAPGDKESRERLTEQMVKVGELLRKAGRLPAALAMFQNELAITRPLAEAAPTEQGPRMTLAKGLQRVAEVMAKLEQPAASEPLQQLVALWQGAVLQEATAQGSAMRSRRMWLAMAQQDLGREFARQRRFPEALAALDAGLAVEQQLADEDAKQPRNRLAKAHTMRGHSRVLAGDAAAGASDLRRAVELCRDNASVLGRFETGRALAVLSGLAQVATSGVSAAESATFADHAIAALRAAIALGWKQATELQRPEFAALRVRADFRELEAELQRK